MTAQKPNIGKIQNRYDALRCAREWLDKVQSQKTEKEEVIKDDKNMRITNNPEIRPNITVKYSIKDVIEKAIDDDPIASKLSKSGKNAIVKALSSDPDIKKNIG